MLQLALLSTEKALIIEQVTKDLYQMFDAMGDEKQENVLVNEVKLTIPTGDIVTILLILSAHKE